MCASPSTNNHISYLLFCITKYLNINWIKSFEIDIHFHIVTMSTINCTNDSMKALHFIKFIFNTVVFTFLMYLVLSLTISPITCWIARDAEGWLTPWISDISLWNHPLPKYLIRPTASQKPSSITLHRRDCSELQTSFKIINHGSDVADTCMKEGLSIHQLKPTLIEKNELIHWLGNLNNIILF